MNKIPMVLVLAWAGCSADPSLAVDQSPIQQELPIAAQLTFRRYWDPEVTLTAYAAARLNTTGGTCSAMMIGPNVLISAAHCGPGDRDTATFLTYAQPSATGLAQETFNCHFLYQTFADTDLAVYFCDPNGAGVSPGDKYGYVDVDPSPVAVNDSVYSIWWNPLASPPVGNALLYSDGSVNSNTDCGWYTPGTTCDGVATNVYCAPGASGSPQLRISNHRVTVAPTSVGFFSNPPNEGPGRGALPIREQLRFSSVDATQPQNLNTARLAGLGLTAANYGGSIDKNGDFVLDVQHDLEQVRGENARDFYYLGFESERRNALWVASGATFNPTTGTAHIVNTATSALVLSHQKLNLPAATYRVSITTNAAVAQPGALQLGLFVNGVAQSSVTLGVQAGAHVQAFRLVSTSPGAELRVYALDGMTVDLSALTLIAEGASMNFDTHDRRLGWITTDGVHRAPILPEGVAAAPGAGSADWAGDALALGVGPYGYKLGDLWSLQHHQLALVRGRTYRICFDVRARGTTAMPPGGTAAVRVVGASSEDQRYNFQPSSAWQHFCTPAFKTWNDDDVVEFGGTYSGLVPTQPQIVTSPEYVVDNVQITDQCPTSACGCVDLTSDPNNCGGCGHVCAWGTTCSASMCVCATGMTQCGTHCVDLTSDGSNCGRCGHRCLRGQWCNDGFCDTGIPQ